MFCAQWETTHGESEFFFCNRLTGERTLARRKGMKKAETSLSPVAVSASEHPTEALIAAMESGYGIGVFSHLLGYNLNLNTRLVNCTLRYGEPTTALEWAVEDDRLYLVHLFLDHGADADFTIPC
jgi:serum/glucocorticoid-regulated kinase 2